MGIVHEHSIDAFAGDKESLTLLIGLPQMNVSLTDYVQ